MVSAVRIDTALDPQLGAGDLLRQGDEALADLGRRAPHAHQRPPIRPDLQPHLAVE